MTIGLIDVDSHNFPNLSLMKLTARQTIKAFLEKELSGLIAADAVYVAL